MSTGSEIVRGLEKAFREKSFNSRDSIVRPAENGAYLFEWKSDEARIQGELLHEDSIGVLVNSLILEKNIQGSQDTEEYLKKVAEAVEKRVTYLQEPLKVVELDAGMKAVQMRSEKPEMREGFVSYFELIVKSGKWFGHRNHISLHRYSHHPEDEINRKVTAFPLTKHQLERLLDDLLDIV